MWSSPDGWIPEKTRGLPLIPRSWAASRRAASSTAGTAAEVGLGCVGRSSELGMDEGFPTTNWASPSLDHYDRARATRLLAPGMGGSLRYARGTHRSK